MLRFTDGAKCEKSHCAKTLLKAGRQTYVSRTVMIEVTGNIRSATGHPKMPGIKPARPNSTAFTKRYTVGIVRRHIFHRGGACAGDAPGTAKKVSIPGAV